MFDEKHIDDIFRSLKENEPGPEIKSDWYRMRSDLVSEGLIPKKKTYRGFILFFSSLFALSFFAGNWFLSTSLPSNNLETTIPQKEIISQNKINHTTLSNSENPDHQNHKSSIIIPSASDSTIHKQRPIDTSSKKASDQKIQPKKYSVQIGAFINEPQAGAFENITDLIILRKDKDPYTRYYAGEYEQRKDAEHRMIQLKELGYEAFIVDFQTPLPESSFAHSSANPISTSTPNQPMVSDDSYFEIETVAKDSKATTIAEATEELPLAVSSEIDEGISSSPPLLSDSTVNPDSIRGIQDSLIEEQSSPPPTQETKDTDDFSRWTVGLYVSKNISSHTVNEIRETTWLNQLTNNYDDYLSSKKQYSIEANVHYRLSRKISVGLAFIYSKKGRLQATFENGSLITDSSSQERSPTIFDFTGNYIDLPLTVNYAFLNKEKLSLYVGAGFVFNINSPFGQKSTYQEINADNRLAKITLQPHSFNSSLLIKSGIEYHISQKLSTYLEPRYQYGITPIVRHPNYQIPIDQFIRSYSFGGGIIYHLK